MQSNNNFIVVASAGGRKTTFIVEEALKKHGNILITTYTLNNVDQIHSYIIEKVGYIPANINILPWFTFLLRDGVKPYQGSLLQARQVKSLDFNTMPNRYIPKGKTEYFINQGDDIYRDRVSDFICQCNEISHGLVIKRLEKIYDHIFIDEMQDLSGWDQDLIGLLIASTIGITLVGDPRQSTYTTNNSQKNKGTKGKNMVSWIEDLVKKQKCIREERTDCYRCNQEICNFADSLYPDLPKTTSKNTVRTGHDGIFTIKSCEVNDYIAKYKPQILRWNKQADTQNYQAINYGNSKGMNFDRVLIFPTDPIKKYLNSKEKNIAPLKSGAISKLYVAVTRARHSVCFIID